MAQNIPRLSVNLGGLNIDTQNRTFYVTHEPSEDACIMRWLSPIESNSSHQSAHTGQSDGVGNWILETKQFREWRGDEGGADKAVLFCSGNSEVEKTYPSSVVIDGLRDEAGKEDIAVASLYYSSLAQEEQTIINMLGAILKQLVGRGHIPWYLREAFREAKTELGTRRPQLSDLVRMLRLTIASIPRVFICIYGLDECLPNRLPELLGPLGDIVRELPRTRILLTGRSHIEKDIYRYFAKAVVIPIGPNADGIKNFLEPGSDRGTKPDAMNDCSQSYTSVKTIMMERVSDMCVRVFGTPARAALLIAANGHLIAAFFVCVLAFLAYVFSSSLSKIFSFHK